MEDEEEATETAVSPPDPVPPEGAEPNHIRRIRAHFGERFPEVPVLHLNAPHPASGLDEGQLEAEIEQVLAGQAAPEHPEAVAAQRRIVVSELRNTRYRNWLALANPEGFLTDEDQDADA